MASAVPPLPEQLSEKVDWLLSGPTSAEPAVGRAPLQAPLALQLVALLALQLNVVVAPGSTMGSAAVRDTVGAGAELTVTVAVREMLPPGPVQVSENLVVVLKGPTVSLPLTGLVPDHPSFAWQAVEFAAVQVRSAVWPLSIVDGVTDTASVGAGSEVGGGWLPPVPDVVASVWLLPGSAAAVVDRPASPEQAPTSRVRHIMNVSWLETSRRRVVLTPAGRAVGKSGLRFELLATEGSAGLTRSSGREA
jgi:hypothetical protein